MRKSVLFVIFLLLPGLLVIAGHLLKGLNQPSLQPALAMVVLRIVLFLVALMDLIFPWILVSRLSPGSPVSGVRPGAALGPRSLLLGFAFNLSPAFYGVILFLLGGQAFDLYFLAGLSFLGTLVWGIRQTSVEAPF